MRVYLGVFIIVTGLNVLISFGCGIEQGIRKWLPFFIYLEVVLFLLVFGVCVLKGGWM